MKKYKLCSIIAFLMIVFCACSTMNVSHVDNNGEIQKSEGIYYSLPKTVITVAVTVEKTSKVKGPFASYALKYLGLTDVISENTSSYAMSSVTLGSYSIPDPDQYFFIESCKLKKKNIMLSFEEYGVLKGVNNRYMNSYKNNYYDTSVVTVSNENEIPEQNFMNPNIAEAFDTIIEKINLDTNIIIKKTIKKVYVDKTTERKAKEAADFIIELEESRLSLLTGYSEVNYSKEAIEYMAVQLEKTEQEYLHLFTGITVKSEYKYYFSYIPVGNNTALSVPLFRLSDKYGICDTSDYKGESVYINIEPSGSTNNITSFEALRFDPKEKHHGIYYRIPEKANISIMYKDRQIASSDFLVAQFGPVCELQAKGIKSLSLNPESGSVQKVVFGKRKHGHFKHH
ncbi:MAG: DUF4831 family protein [Bacteroidota bacterium]